MKISTAPQLGNAAVAVPRGTIAGAEKLNAATGQVIGNTLTRIGDDEVEQRTNLARAKAANALSSRQLAVDSVVEKIRDQVSTGQLSWDKAESTFQSETGKFKAPKVDYLDEVGQQALSRGLEEASARGGVQARVIAKAGEQQDFRDQFATALDTLGKLAGQPGADVADINAKADAWKAMAAKAQIPKDVVDGAIQNFKDRNWFNQATQRAMLAKDSMPDLQKLEHELSAADGFYNDKLDSERRNQVLNQVINHQSMLENKQTQQAAKRDTAAARVMNEIDRQIASGVPATAAMWSDWGNKVQGTQFEQDFKDRLDDERDVQAMLRLPIDQQLKAVQDKQAALLNGGGTVRDATNLARLTTAVQQNVKLLQESPLQFNANRLGADVQPLDMSELVAGQPTGAIAAQIKDRVVTLAAMRKQYGDQVPMKPLLPQEATALASALHDSTPAQQSQMFASLYSAIGDNAAYKAAMQQIAPDSPVKAMAGMLAANQANLTTASHWFKPDEIKFSGDVSATLLQGESLLNASKADKAADGKPNSKLYLPEANTLQSDFQDKVGSAFSGRPGAAEIAFQAVKAYYVGRAAQTGRLAANNKDIDSGLVKEAITATLGTVVDFNGQGEVFAPWGMDRSTFLNKAGVAMVAAAKREGLDAGVLNAFGDAGLRQAGENSYYVVNGRNFVYGKDGKPIVITVAP